MPHLVLRLPICTDLGHAHGILELIASFQPHNNSVREGPPATFLTDENTDVQRGDVGSVMSYFNLDTCYGKNLTMLQIYVANG